MMVTFLCVYALIVTYVDSRQGPVHVDHHFESLMSVLVCAYTWIATYPVHELSTTGSLEMYDPNTCIAIGQ
jgi:hypothetical protein